MKFMKTVKLGESHVGLDKMIKSSQQPLTYRTKMPRYTHNEDIFNNVPYVKPTLDRSRKSLSINPASGDNMRPSHFFLTLNRDLQKQDIYIDQYDGPSSLITRSPDRENKTIRPNEKNPFQEERDELRRSLSTMNFSKASSGNTLLPEILRKSVSIPEGNSLLRNSKQQFQDFLQERQNQENFKELKEKKNFITKREKLLKSGWRHGVIGIENPINPSSDVYNELHKTQSKIQMEKDIINNRRKKSLNKNLHKVDKEIDIDHQWKSKKISPERFKGSHSRIFESHIPTKREIMKARRLKVDI
ncbi:unnamed protein product [Moneuplotes crassus]|uniref:Uncharacterized protein n=1 Tax=Euplotes crassus TaxID=5936 RepID=A0AAD2D163_EUPCR|nr:unnamed protein product [Moneuplotes crassus]